jgi:hypothetical protein
VVKGDVGVGKVIKEEGVWEVFPDGTICFCLLFPFGGV